MCRAETQMFLSVSASIAREMSCTQMWQYPGVLCNTPGEFYSLFFPSDNNFCCVRAPFSTHTFHLAILPLQSTLIQSTHSLFTLFWIEKASSFCGSDPGMSSGEDESKRVIINEVFCLRVCIDKVLWLVSKPLRESWRFPNTKHTLKTLTCFRGHIINARGSVSALEPLELSSRPKCIGLE